MVYFLMFAHSNASHVNKYPDKYMLSNISTSFKFQQILLVLRSYIAKYTTSENFDLRSNIRQKLHFHNKYLNSLTDV